VTARKPTLSVTNLEVRYGAARAVTGVTYEVESGAVLTLLGANGAGKSSIARACSGLVRPVAGVIELDGVDITGWSADKIRRAGLVYLPEGRGIFPNLTVAENLRLAVRLVDRPHEAMDKAYTIFPVLAGRRSQRAGSLSGGEQQMVSLARALTGEPTVVIVDEPSLGLAPIVVEQVFSLLDDAKRGGLTMIVIEQFAHRALALSDQCAILRRGSITWSGAADAASEVLSEHYLGSSS
jgi:branched-chain amino acid transport system ATP-binding protein